MSLDNWEDFPLHPLCELLPEMSEQEYSELVSDIKANGLQEPIVLFEDDDGEVTYVLDGRNRRLACLDADVEPDFTFYTGDNALNYVVSKNVKRRHLSAGQLAAMAAEVASWEVGQNQFTKDEGTMTREKAAEMFGVSEKSISRYRTIRESDPALAGAVRSGAETLAGAYGRVRQTPGGEDGGASEKAKPATSKSTDDDAPTGNPKGGDVNLTNPDAVEPEHPEPISKKDVEKNLERMKQSDEKRLPVFQVTDVVIDDLCADGEVILETGSLRIKLTYAAE